MMLHVRLWNCVRGWVIHAMGCNVHKMERLELHELSILVGQLPPKELRCGPHLHGSGCNTPLGGTEAILMVVSHVNVRE